METIESKNDTLFGGRTVTVTFEDAETRVITVEQLRLKRYEEAFRVLDSEFAITAVLSGLKAEEVETLTPESYEGLRSICQEVNEKGFFVYAERRHRVLVQRLNDLTPQMLEAASKVATSSTSSPRSRPRPV